MTRVLCLLTILAVPGWLFSESAPELVPFVGVGTGYPEVLSGHLGAGVVLPFLLEDTIQPIAYLKTKASVEPADARLGFTTGLHFEALGILGGRVGVGLANSLADPSAGWSPLVEFSARVLFFYGELDVVHNPRPTLHNAFDNVKLSMGIGFL